MESTTETEKIMLKTPQVAKMLGVHRNTLYAFYEDLNPVKADNGRDNLYDPDVVKAFKKKRREEFERLSARRRPQ